MIPPVQSTAARVAAEVEAAALTELHGERYAAGYYSSRRGLYEHHLRVLRQRRADLLGEPDA
ncbi:hypothetical protein [Sphingomonas lenta]|uniref:Uncharacterized protein n=1 Tax=Sphingomonas lenta TaxID=1141887 RepID=A0A2A2SHZ4_9SPHN|nr:hypothetical protein [Sphingomonas lenta]PAX08838.1 hypothetical protein CKY28_05645 [Sphingomonas lenta]